MKAGSTKTSAGGGFGGNTTSNAFKKTPFVGKPVDPLVMEEFRNITTELATNDWNKRLKAIDNMLAFINNNIAVIKSA